MFPNSTAAETSHEVVVSATFTPERQGPSMVGVLGSGGGLWCLGLNIRIVKIVCLIFLVQYIQT